MARQGRRASSFVILPDSGWVTKSARPSRVAAIIAGPGATPMRAVTVSRRVSIRIKLASS